MKILSESLHSHLEWENSCGLFNHLFYLRVCSSLPHNSQGSWVLEKLGAVSAEPLSPAEQGSAKCQVINCKLHGRLCRGGPEGAVAKGKMAKSALSLRLSV